MNTRNKKSHWGGLFQGLVKGMMLGVVLFYFVGSGLALNEALAPESGLNRYGASSEEEERVRELIGKLKDGDPDVRYEAGWALGNIGAAALTALVGALEDESKGVRFLAAWALGRIGDAAAPAVTALVKALGDESEDVRSLAALALGNIGAAAVSALPALVKAMGDENENVRTMATWASSNIGPVAAPALVAALRDENPNVRSNVARALGEITRVDLAMTEQITHVFSARLAQETDPLVREEIELVLEHLAFRVGITSPEPIPAWSFEETLEILRQRPSVEESLQEREGKRYQAWRRLVLLLRAHASLLLEVKSLLENPKAEDEQARPWLAQALGTVRGNADVLRLLEKIAESRQENPLVRQGAVMGIENLGQKSSLGVLERIKVGVKEDLEKGDLSEADRKGLRGLKLFVESAIHSIKMAPEPDIVQAPTEERSGGGGGGLGPSRAVFQPTLDGMEGSGGLWHVSGGALIETPPNDAVDAAL